MTLSQKLLMAKAFAGLRKAGFVKQARRAKHRTCGDCSLCCTVRGVDALGKPPGVSCDKLGVVGSSCSRCTVYAAKPSECSDYYCGWRLGFLSPHDRPDWIGAVPDLNVENGKIAWTVRAGPDAKPEQLARILEHLVLQYPIHAGVVPFGTAGGVRIAMMLPGSKEWDALLALLREGAIPSAGEIQR